MPSNPLVAIWFHFPCALTPSLTIKGEQFLCYEMGAMDLKEGGQLEPMFGANSFPCTQVGRSCFKDVRPTFLHCQSELIAYFLIRGEYLWLKQAYSDTLALLFPPSKFLNRPIIYCQQLFNWYEKTLEFLLIISG